MTTTKAKADDGRMAIDTQPVTDRCPCAQCSTPVYDYEETRRVVVNNVHGRLRPCEECGRAKTEYVDLGRKGRYKCWWCNDRAASEHDAVSTVSGLDTSGGGEGR